MWWHTDNDFLVMPNASNTEELLAALSTDGGVRVADVTAERAVLAVQGPDARSLLQSVSAEIASVPRFCVRDVAWAGHHLVVAGTGYTGEDGVEIQVPVAGAVALWESLLGAGIVPAGLGARDTLRLEAGLPLHGHELGAGITPLQARLGWVVGWDKPRFRGREALLAERARGPHRRLVAVTTEGRQPPREGYPILAGGHVVGEVTSGNFSPMLGHGIALAFVDSAVADDAPLSTEFRGKTVPATRVALPFVARTTRD